MSRNVDRYLTARGTYVPDIDLPGTKHAAFVRSPHAHARIRSIDTARASALPGVRAVFSAQHLTAAGIRPMSHLMPDPPFRPLAWPLLTADKARYVGDPVAVVVADTPYIAEDAAELVAVDYQELPFVRNCAEALAPGAPLLYDEWATNEFVADKFQHGPVDDAFAEAFDVVAARFEHHRVSGLPLEGRGVLAHQEISGRLVVHASTQFPHQMQAVLAEITGDHLDGIRVIAPDVGGGFGVKQHVTREELLVAVLARLLGHPVRWVQGVCGTLRGDVHARKQHHDVEAAYAADGRLLAVRLSVTADVGTPLLYFTGAGPAFVTAASLPGAYDIGAYSYEVRAVVTNSPPVGGFRGFGQPQAVFTVERVLDIIADRLSLSPVEVRRINLLPDTPRPFVSCTGARYDVGSVRTQFDRLLDAVPTDVEPAPEPWVSGRGFACYVEPTAPNLHSFAGRYGAFETATVAVQPDGRVIVQVGTKDLGQGNTSAFARIVASELGIPEGHVIVRDGDTDLMPLGLGTMGSRTIVLAGCAVGQAARQVHAKLTAIAATHPKARDIADIADIAYHQPHLLPAGIEPGVFATAVANAPDAEAFPSDDGYVNAATTYASHAACASIRLDLVSGEVLVTDFTVVHDCGTVISPADLLGQVQGSFAHGLSGTLFEEIRFATDNSATGSLNDYLVARATDVPPVRAIDAGTPSRFGTGARGGGQLATILAPAAIANAVSDALRPYGIQVNRSDLTPGTIRRLIADVESVPLRLHRLLP